MKTTLIFFAALLLALQGFGQTLSAQVTAGRVRSKAPQPLNIKLTWGGTGMLEGVLEISVRDGTYQLLTWRTPEMALAAGTREVAFLLPAAPTSLGYADSLKLRFVAGSRALELGDFDLGNRGSANRALVICVNRSAAAAGGASEIWPAVRFEQAGPPVPDENVMIRVTSPAFLEPADFPADALGYCAFDMVVLDGAGFGELRTKQLAALENWVQAGGSLCLAPGRDLKEAQRAWVARLEAVCPREQQGEPVRRIFYGLGRVALGAESGVAGAQPWKAACEFLWKKKDEIYADRFEGTLDQGIIGLLMPRSVRVVPGLVLLGMLGGFLLVIGPLDFWLLGKLRMRRWTWVLFPCTALAFTGLMMAITARYMGAGGVRSALIITDLGASGRVVRESRIELIFSPISTDVRTEVRNALACPVSSGREYRGVPRFEGQYPARFSLTQSVGKWAPQLNRFLSIEPAEDPSGLNWEALAALVRQTLRNSSDAQALRDAAGPLPADILVFERRGDEPMVVSALQGGNLMMDKNLLQRLCVPGNARLPNFVSQISPNGAGDFADLPMIEAAADPDTRLLVAVRREGPNVHVFRKLQPR